MPTALTAILGLFSGFTLFLARRNHLAIKLLEETPTTPIQDLKEGHHEIKGTVSDASSTVHAPMSGETCVWYSLKVEESVKQDKGRRWVTRGRLTRHGECFVEDDTGMCLVDLHDADDDLTVGTRGASGTFDDPSESELAALDALGLSSENLLGMNRRFRYSETILQRGEPLFAHGPCELDEHGMMVMRSRDDERVFFSTKSEETIIATHKRWRTVQFLVFIVSGIGALVSLVI